MAISIKHPFTSLKGDGGDATLIRPSNWNAAHTTSMATLNLLGRLTAGAGAFEELPTSAFMIAALAATDAASFLAALNIGAFETGDVKFSIQPTAAAGWIVYNLNIASGTIGNAVSGATVRANADCSALFQLIWNSIADADAPVLGGRGGSALADWNTGHQITLPWIPSRTIIGAAGGATLQTRVIGRMYGEENHILSIAEAPANIPVSVTGTASVDSTLTVGLSPTATLVVTSGSGDFGWFHPGGAAPVGGLHSNGTIAGTGVASGGGGAHNNIQPSIALWAKVKL